MTPSSHLADALEALRDGVGIPPLVPTLSLGACVISAATALSLGIAYRLRRRRGDAPWRLALAAVVLLGVFLGTVTAGIVLADRAIALRPISGAEETNSHDLSRLITALLSSLELGGGGGTIAAVLSFAALALGVRTASPARGPHLPCDEIVLAGVAIMIALTLGGISRFGHEVDIWGRVASSLDPSRRHELLSDMFNRASAWLRPLRWALPTIATMTGVGATVAAWRDRGAAASRAFLLASAAMFLGGVGSFAVTRAHAEDAASPIPIPEWNISLAEPRPHDPPVFDRCDPHDLFATYVILPGGFVGEWKTRPDAEFEEVLRRDVDRINYIALYNRNVQPAKEVALAAGAREPMSRMRSFLATAARAGMRRIAVLAPRRLVYTTLTLGPITRFEECHRSFDLDEAGVAAGRFFTWGDLARAITAGTSRIAP